jgi:hypothetical protein
LLPQYGRTLRRGEFLLPSYTSRLIHFEFLLPYPLDKCIHAARSARADLDVWKHAPDEKEASFVIKNARYHDFSILDMYLFAKIDTPAVC